MKTAKIIGFAAIGAGLLVGSLVSAQYYNQYGYQYPTAPVSYQYPGTPSYGGVCPAIYSNLTIGSTGAQVVELQRFLSARYGIANLSGGYFGTLTSHYVAQFQREQGVSPATGGVGPLTRAAIMRVCGGGYTPGYPTQPGTPNTETFRLDREFDLYEGQSARERSGDLVVTLDRIGGSNNWYNWSNDDEVRITLTESCGYGRNCLWTPRQSFMLEEGDTVDFQDYEIELTDLRNNRASFVVTDEDGNDDDDDEDGTVEVTSPNAGEVYEQGDELEITWSVTDEPSNSSVVLDLYDEDDDRVGTIAIEDADEESFEWDIPERGDFCTQQYPNELCGYDLDGEFYIKATLVEGNGFGGGYEIDEDESPIFEIED